MWWCVGSQRLGDSRALRTRAGNGCYAVSLFPQPQVLMRREGGSPNELQHGKLRASAMVSECQNRPSGETSHSNWWLCIRQMHFYRVIHLSLSFLPLFLAAMFPYCHYSLLPYHLPLGIFFFIFPLYTSTYSFYPSSLPLVCLTSVRKKWAIKKEDNVFFYWLQ